MNRLGTAYELVAGAVILGMVLVGSGWIFSIYLATVIHADEIKYQAEISKINASLAEYRCQGIADIDLDYSSDAAISDTLKQFSKTYTKNITGAVWEVSKPGSGTSIHRVTGDDTLVFAVNRGTGGSLSGSAVYWVDRGCFLDQ
ncbi:MAG TPA: hypothetical protein VF813_10930 [Anaerolineaceae bacterium]